MTLPFDETVLPWLLVAVLALAVLLALVAFAARRDRQRAIDHKLVELSVVASGLSQTQAEVMGRLKQLSDVTASAQSEQTRVVNARLDTMAAQMRETLDLSSVRTAESLGSLQKHLSVIDQAQRNIIELSQQVVGLQDLLANKQARGAFGEIQLNDLVRNALPPDAFELQATLNSGSRADCLIRLPNPPGPIAIDSKFPLEGYQAMRAAPDEAARIRAARKFRLAVMKHVRDIAERYIVVGETAESALMFLPSEAIYAEIHTNFRDVIEDSYRRRVWIVSPTTLWALLNTVRAVLKDVRMRTQANIIQREVAVLLEDVYRLDQRIVAMQKHLDQAGEDVRQARTSTDKITRRGARIREVEIEAPEKADPTAQLPLIDRPTRSA